MPDVLELLHRSYGNSIYVVLDGPSAQRSAEGHQAGISVLDTDSSSFAADNSDLQLCRGAAVISKQFKVPLASDWKLDFDISEETGSGFYNPYFLTKGQKLKGNIARFAFLGPISGVLQADTDRGQLLYTADSRRRHGDRCSRRNHAEGADLFASEK